MGWSGDVVEWGVDGWIKEMDNLRDVLFKKGKCRVFTVVRNFARDNAPNVTLAIRALLVGQLRGCSDRSSQTQERLSLINIFDLIFVFFNITLIHILPSPTMASALLSTAFKAGRFNLARQVNSIHPSFQFHLL